MMKRRVIWFICFMILFTVTTNCFAQDIISREVQEATVRDLCQKLEKYYFIPNVGAKLSKSILDKQKTGGYKANISVNNFLEELNTDLFNISKDSHLKLLFVPEQAKELSDTSKQSNDETDRMEQERWLNYGVKEIKMLDGRIGYMNLTDFSSIKEGGKKIVSAMNFFEDCKALIIDLRQNGGGNDNMVVFLSSYFITSDGPILLNIGMSTIDGEYYASVIPGYAAGKTYLNIPIYLLTSRITASAAERFVNVMKYYNKNVVVVGNKTKGARNPVNHLVVNKDYILRIPCWRNIYSAFESEGEGVGVKPDIQAEFNKTLPYAYFDALKKTKNNLKSEDDKFQYQWALDRASAMIEPYPVDIKLLKKYAGNYNGTVVHLENGVLHYGSDKLRMIPVNENYFLVESADFHRIKFISEGNKIIALDRIFVYGNVARITKTEKD